MGKADKFLGKLAMASDLPDERMPGQTLVEIVDSHRVLIENYQGVRVYETNSVHVKVKFGMVCISGCNLELARMTKGQLVITGTIECVKLVRG